MRFNLLTHVIRVNYHANIQDGLRVSRWRIENIRAKLTIDKDYFIWDERVYRGFEGVEYLF